MGIRLPQWAYSYRLKNRNLGRALGGHYPTSRMLQRALPTVSRLGRTAAAPAPRDERAWENADDHGRIIEDDLRVDERRIALQRPDPLAPPESAMAIWPHGGQHALG